MQNNDEIGSLLNNILWLQKQMPEALKNWQRTKPVCKYFTDVIKNICELPGTIDKVVFDPVLRWLADYQLFKEGKLNLKTKNLSLDDFLKIGLRVISKFIIITEFLSGHTDFLAPYPDSSTKNKDPEYTNKLFAANKAQKEYSQFLDILSSKLIGCNEKAAFIFLNLSKVIKNLSPELEKMKSYLENRCTNLKIKSLKN